MRGSPGSEGSQWGGLGPSRPAGQLHAPSRVAAGGLAGTSCCCYFSSPLPPTWTVFRCSSRPPRSRRSPKTTPPPPRLTSSCTSHPVASFPDGPAVLGGNCTLPAASTFPRGIQEGRVCPAVLTRATDLRGDSRRGQAPCYRGWQDVEEGTLVSDTGASGPQACAGWRIWGTAGGVRWGHSGLYLHALVWELSLGGSAGRAGWGMGGGTVA